MESLLARHWHTLDTDEVARLLDSDIRTGLSTFEVKHRLETYGPNTVTGQEKLSPLKRLILQFHNPLIYILLTATLITALLQEWVDSGVIFGVVLINAIVGYIQETKAEEAIESLKRMVTTEATVLREDKKMKVPSSEIVAGDVILLGSGDKVPADIRLATSRDLQVDESVLTGESVPVMKITDILPHETILAERTNIAYAGTLVTYGQGRGVVVGTGDGTETGRIATLIKEALPLETPLTKRIAKFSKWLLFVILGLAAVTFAVGILRSQPPIEMFMAAVALAVGAIPEGLPAALTITLAIGVGRMAKRRAIIRKMPAVETLGSTTVICSDKTGTLTENQMTVQKVLAGDEIYEFTGGGYKPEGSIILQGNQIIPEPCSPLAECLNAGVLCNDSQLIEEEGWWKVQGDPTEGALIAAAAKGGLTEAKLQANLPRIDAIPFESDKQYMATLHNITGQNAQIIYIKGSTEKILKRSSQILKADGTLEKLDARRIVKITEEMATEGLRVLAFAFKKPPKKISTISDDNVSDDLIFLGLQAMIDPPRPEAINAVGVCQTAGIDVKMITGDHALTAAAIAKQLGLACKTDPAREFCITTSGQELEQLSDEELIGVAEDTSVFARVAPEQKLRLVDALQAKGHVVAMTGDGVNDAPALKQADIGIAMGKGGTEVAKEASDMVLTDDNFASIEAAVEEGRGVFDNLTKFIVWTLPTNLGEGLVILAAIFIGAVLPILPVQILWINMTTAICLGMMLAFEPKEPGIMMRPPRHPKSPIMNTALIFRTLLVGILMTIGAFGLFNLELSRGATSEEARSVAVNVFVMVEMFYLFNSRSLTRPLFAVGFLSNPLLLLGAFIMITLQMLYTYVPLMNRFFHSAPIGIEQWIKIVGVAICISTIVIIEKVIRGKMGRGAYKYVTPIKR